MTKKLLTILLFLCVLVSLGQTDKESTYKTISGFISFQNKPMRNVAVSEINSNNVVFTNSEGFYKINAKVGHSLIYSHIGFKQAILFIEDVSDIINLKMRKEDLSYKLDQNKSLKLGGSRIGLTHIGLHYTKIDVDSLNREALSLTAAILEKVPFFHTQQNQFKENLIYVKGNELNGPVIWNIDGYLYDIPIPIFIDEVKALSITKTNFGNFTINIKTNINYNKVTDINYDDFYFSDDDYYQNDATPYRKIKRYIPDYLKDYKGVSNVNELLKIYENQDKKDKTNYHFNIINYIKNIADTKDILLRILKDYEILVSKNTEELKRIAYKYDELGANEKALAIYKKNAKLRPNYRQSYRDLANCFLNLKRYKDFWKIYTYYLSKGFKIEDNDIGEIITSEIITAYNNDQEGHSINKIKIENPKKIKDCDVRLVFEWNTSEAEFIIEFVNHKKQIFKVENSIYNNNQLINDQKEKGYTSKEVLIESLKKRNILVNFTYLGNKKYTSTTLKVTAYFNWGKPNQFKKVEVFDFTLKDKKIQLLSLDKRQVISKNKVR